MKKLFALFAVMMIFAVACGDDDDGGSSSDSALGDAIAVAILSSAGDDEFAPTEDQADCIAGAVIDTVGEDKLAELGVTAESIEEGMALEEAGLSEEEMQEYVDASLECLDLTGVITESLVSDGMSEEDAECIAEGLPDDLMSDFAETDPTSNPEVMNAMLDVMSDCDVTDFG